MIDIKIDSRKVVPGDTFVAIKGHTVDGHDFIDKAIQNGATKIICEKEINIDVPYEVVESSEKWLNDYIVNNYSNKVNEMNIIAITGTSGKTTTAYLTYQMLNKLGSKTAYIGTIGFYQPDKPFIELSNTTPNILDLYENLLEALANNCQNVVMEVSSHALYENRVAGLKFRVGLFTNLSQDHLDFHKTMKQYLEAKMLILNSVYGDMIVNADDETFDRWYNKNNNIKTYGVKGNNYKLIKYQDDFDGTIVDFKTKNGLFNAKINLKNEYNVYNFLSAFAICNELGFEESNIISTLKDVYPPKGRCEMVKVKGGLAVVDYAHKPDAVKKIITAFNQHKKGKIITLVGCGGDRDKTKRPVMGNIAASLSDIAIFTSDNPRTENPEDILNDILTGVKGKKNYEVEIDRVKAIKKGLDMIEDGDVFLILGKGHEDYQIIGHEKHHLDDMEEVNKYIDSLK